MLWYKSWLETRWRFLIGLALLMCSAIAVVVIYPKVIELMPRAQEAASGGGILARKIQEVAELARDFGGYVWSQWFRQNMAQFWTMFAVILGTGGVLTQPSGSAVLFTLSLPVSRNKLLAVRTATGLGELSVLAILPSLLISVLAPGVGESYSVARVLVHGACMFVAGTVFFSFAVLLSTAFADFWKPLMIALAVPAVIALFEAVLPRDLSLYGIFSVMSGEAYFRSGTLPWVGLLLSAAISSGLLYAASANLARRDF